MTVKQLTTSPTEADLEASITGALHRAFPWLPAGSIRHQTKFSFTFGHKQIHIDSNDAWRAGARSDILLYWYTQPLAVLELKRYGVPLTPADDLQGLSYAQVLVPPAPLVIVTNGKDVRIIATHTGKEWHPTQHTEQAFQDLIDSASLVATADIKLAIDTLMGTSVAVWQQAVRHTTAATLGELSATWDQPARPFIRDFLIPRKATEQVFDLVMQGTKLIFVEGAPLSGKSNVLREISQRTAQHKDLTTLYVEGGTGYGILRQLADTLSRSLSWPVSPEETRSWLMRVSKAQGPKLLLAIDGLEIDNCDARREIEDFSSGAFDNGLHVIVALDDSVAEQVVLTPNRRSDSTIGRRARRVRVAALDDHEFRGAESVLFQHHLTFMHGAFFSPEYRQPWVLRAIGAPVAKSTEAVKPNLAAILPPLLSMDLIHHARARFTDDELRRVFRAVAEAVLEDAKDHERAPSLIMESLEIFVVRRKTLKNYLDPNDLTWLLNHGLLKPKMHASEDPVLFVRLPELLASELASLLADELATMARSDPHQAARWIAAVASNLPIGDVITAQAIFDAAHGPESIPFDLIAALIKMPPRREQVPPGSRFAIHIPDAGLVDLAFRANGTAAVVVDGNEYVIDVGDDEISHTYVDYYPWLILAHLAAFPSNLEMSNGFERIDTEILSIIGAADIALRKPQGDLEKRAVPTHDLPGIGSIVCHKAGIIEPITLSIFRFLARNCAEASAWIDRAITVNSMPLLVRIHIALLQISRLVDAQLSVWAADTLAGKISPALKSFPHLHEDEQTQQ